MVRFIRDTFCGHEFCDSRPDKATIDIDERFAKRILRLAREVKRLGVYKISEFNYTPDFHETGFKKPSWTLDCVILEVSDDHFHWSALIKHTDIEVLTNAIYIKDLERKFPQLVKGKK